MRRTIQPWLWLNLLNLDAPLIAVLWQVFVARCRRVELDAAPTAVLAGCVWLIYAADRLFDTRFTQDPQRESPRHKFHRRHRKILIGMVGVVLLNTAWLSWTHLAPRMFRAGIILLLGVGLYLGVIHLMPDRLRQYCPKELMVSLLFAIGTFLAIWSDDQRIGGGFFLFFALCWINCTAIEYWEWRRRLRAQSNVLHRSTLWIGTRVGTIALGLATWAMLIPETRVPEPICIAVALSATGFFVLDRFWHKLSSDALRVLADAVLLSPAVLLPFVAR